MTVNSPLAGLQIVVTRARTQSPVLASRLSELGATVIEMPVIEIVDPPDGGIGLREALEQINNYSWLVITSSNTVERVAPYIQTSTVSVAAVGAATAKALAEYGCEAQLIPQKHTAAELLKAFPAGVGRVLLAHSEIADPLLEEGLADKGWLVDAIAAYSTVAADVPKQLLQAAESADVVMFASSSAVVNYLKLAKAPGVVACIGPVTAQTAIDCGLTVDVVADVYTIEGLIASLLEKFTSS